MSSPNLTLPPPNPIIASLDLPNRLARSQTALGQIARVLEGIKEQARKAPTDQAVGFELRDQADCLQLLVLDQDAFIVDKQRQKATEDLEPAVDKVRRRLQKVSRYSLVYKYYGIAGSLQECLTDLKIATENFKSTCGIMDETPEEPALEPGLDQGEVHERLLTLVTAADPDTRQREMQLLHEMSLDYRNYLFGELQQRLRNIQDREEEDQQRNPQTVIPDRSMNDSPAAMTPTSSRSSRFVTIAPQRPVLRHGTEYETTSRIMLDLLKMGINSKITNLDGQVAKKGDVAQAGGVFSDVWLGEWLGTGNVTGQKVALKSLRNVRATEKAIKRFEQQIKIWVQLAHPNILPFYGLCTQLTQNVSIVSEWQEFGNVRKFVEDNPYTDKIKLMRGASDGLTYLHSHGIVHGNVRCANILVSMQQEARICDFGMSKIVEEVTDNSASATLTAGGSARWLSPELISGQDSSPTFSADVYSFAMAVLECLTAKHPYAHCKRDANVIHEVITMKRIPPRPYSGGVQPWLTDDLWKLMEECWSGANNRPEMAHVYVEMARIEKDIHHRLS